MHKNKNDQTEGCVDHLLKILPQHLSCYYQDQIRVSLCPHFDKHGKCSGKKGFEGPVYNKDQAASTPAFVLRSQKDKFKVGTQANQNTGKYFNACDQKSELLFPKPSSKSFYCNVCKEKYDDYRQVINNHIQSHRHKEKINANPFNQHICKLARKYQIERNHSFKEKEKAVFPPSTLSEGTNLIVIDQDSNQDMSKPKKRVKLDPSRECSQKMVSPHIIPALNTYSFMQAQQILVQQRIYEYYINQILLNQMHYSFLANPYQIPDINQQLPQYTPPFYNPLMMGLDHPFMRYQPPVRPTVNPVMKQQSPKSPLIIIQDDI